MIIDAGPSLAAAVGLSGPDVANYLRRTGWVVQPSRVEGVSISSKRLPGLDEPVEFILPMKPGFDDEQRRIADALRTLQGVERRPLALIADDIRRTAGEIERESKPAYRAPGFAEDE